MTWELLYWDRHSIFFDFGDLEYKMYSLLQSTIDAIYYTLIALQIGFLYARLSWDFPIYHNQSEWNQDTLGSIENMIVNSWSLLFMLFRWADMYPISKNIKGK